MPVLGKPLTLSDYYRNRTTYQGDGMRELYKPRGEELRQAVVNRGMARPMLSHYAKLANANGMVPYSSPGVVNEASQGGAVEAGAGGLGEGAVANGAGQYVVDGTIYDGATGAAVGSAGGASGSSGSTSLATWAKLAADAYNGYEVLKNKNMTKNEKLDAEQDVVGGAIVDYYTGGLGGGLAQSAAHKLNVSQWSPSNWAMKKLFGSNTEQEEHRMHELAARGVQTFMPEKRFDNTSHADQLKNFETQYSDVTPDFQGFKDGQWINGKFLTSESEKDLTPQDIWGAANFSENFGNDYYNTNEYQRYRIAKEALRRGLVDEHHGTIDVQKNDEWKQVSQDILSGKAADDPETAAEYEAFRKLRGDTTAPAPKKPSNDSGDDGEEKKKKDPDSDSGPATLPTPIQPPAPTEPSEAPGYPDLQAINIGGSNYGDMLNKMLAASQSKFKKKSK